MNKNLILCLFLLVGLLLPSCTKEEFGNPYESTVEHKDGKAYLRFVMPFVLHDVQSGELANKWCKFRLFSQTSSEVITSELRMTAEGVDKTKVEMLFSEGNPNLNGKYVLSIPTFWANRYNERETRSSDGDSNEGRYVMEIESNTVTSVEAAYTMTGFEVGCGTEEDPYQIASADDFETLLYNLYKDDTDAVGVNFIQMADFSWNDVDESTSTGMNKIESFAGIYDGNGFVIDDMNYFGANSDNYSNVGLFTELKNGAVVKNLIMDNVSFRNVYQNCGSVAGFASGSVTIENVTVSGSMSFEDFGDNIGAILGSASGGTVKISNITNNVSIVGANSNVAGVVGNVENATLEVENFIVNTTQFSVNANNNVGSIAGKISNSNFTIKDVNIDRIMPEQDKDVRIICANTYNVGGAVGVVEGTSQGSLTNVVIRTSVGSESSDYSGSCVGGLIGECKKNVTLEICDSKVCGNVKGYSYVGGFIGLIEGEGQDIESLKFTGTNKIQPEESSYVAVSGNLCVGGIIGCGISLFLKLENPIVINTNVSGVDETGGFSGSLLNSVCIVDNLSFSETMTVEGYCDVGGVLGYAADCLIKGPNTIDFSHGHQSSLPDFDSFKYTYGAKVNGDNCVGGCVGTLYSSALIGVATKANVIGETEDVGGVIGKAYCDRDENVITSNSFDGNVTATGSRIGGIVGYLSVYCANYWYFNNNIAYGNINGGEAVAGVIGFMYSHLGGTYIEYCVNAATINGSGHVGGVIAENSIKSEGARVMYCANFGNITASVSSEEEHSVGGVVGFIKVKPAYVKYCTNHGNITASGYYKAVGGVAGEVGHNTGTVSCSDNAYVMECANFGNISGDHSETYVGGVVGFLQEGSASKGNSCMYDSYNRGEILSDHHRDTGGILGMADHYNTVYRNINFGKVHYGNAIIGYRKNGSAILYVEDNYYLEGSGGDWKASDSFTEGEIGQTSTYKGYDFDNVWEMVDGYPYLRNNPFQRTVF